MNKLMNSISPVEFVAAFVIGLILLFVLIRLLYTPLRLALKLFVNSIFGGILLCFLNFAGMVLKINIGINLITCAVAGVLGVPGIALLLFLQIILNP